MTEASKTDLTTRLARVAKAQTVVLTHYGRKSGKPYRVRIWFTVDGDHVNLQTMNMARQWTRNVQANPRVQLKIKDEVFEGEVTPVNAAADLQRVVQLMKRKYPISLPYLWLKKAPDGAFRVRLLG